MNGFENFTIHLRRHEQTILHPKIIASLDDVNITTDLVEEMSHQSLAKIGNASYKRSREFRMSAKVQHEAIHALHGKGALQRKSKPGRTHDGIFAVLHEFARLSPDMRHACWVVHVRPWVRFYIGDGMTLCKRMNRGKPHPRIAFHRTHAP